ncbi:MAG: hypothetical protein NT082_06840, partial [Chloroflexi bacterium]|nr:hypothetical protein [Chloroflexota bacterium]
RHLNLTYSVIAVITMTIICFCILWYLQYPGAVALAVIMVLVLISSGIWVLMRKGRSLWLAAAALWSCVVAWILFPLNTSDSGGWSGLDLFFNFMFTLLIGTVINVIVVLLLNNIRYKKIATNENGKLVKRWYKVEKPDDNC